MTSQLYIVERNEKSQSIHTSFGKDGSKETCISNPPNASSQKQIWASIAQVFLPTGYPDTVTDDYLRYQILNGLQAFCSSVATLISSRAVLESVGVGDASASATNALLLTTLQDVFSRLTTIISAYYLGSALFPEAKRYRLLADIFNNAAIIVDIFVPMLKQSPLFVAVPGIHVIALCLSGSLRALCGIVAGGSKASITAHFANPVNAKGDMGDLTAKDASKETVLGLAGLLLGTMTVPYLTTQSSTTTAVFVLLIAHLLINYYAVRGLTLRTLNRQRAALAWTHYRQSQSQNRQNRQPEIDMVFIARLERIFEGSGIVRDPETCAIIGKCSIGFESFGTALREAIPALLVKLFAEERYILWINLESTTPTRSSPLEVHIFLKEGFTERDTLKAWAHAVEASLFASTAIDSGHHATSLVSMTHKSTNANFSSFVSKLTELGWNLDEISILTGPPKTVVVALREDKGSVAQHLEGKKNV